MTKETRPAKGSRSGPAEQRMQGHWLLAKMGKRVLRPGGIEMTEHILGQAKPAAGDRIVEFGPGVGRTAEYLLACRPASYTGVDPNPEGAPELRKVLAGHSEATTITASAAETGLPGEAADLVVGEALLTMQSGADKAAIVREAFRILAPGGRYAIHELGLHPDDLDPAVKDGIQRELSRTIKVGARPLTSAEWQEILRDAGFEIRDAWTNPMHLLEPRRMIADEGVRGALRFAANMVRNPAGRKRVLAMRRIFRRYAPHLNAIGIVAVKPGE